MHRPAYTNLTLKALQERAAQALDELGACRVCPWACGVNRLQDERHICRIGRYAVVASYFPHFGEEDCLRGWRGSGTIFFSGCNLRCVFCQNWDISQRVRGQTVTPQQLAAIMLELQDAGCHNINWVTPEHVVPQLLEALPIAVEKGLRLPIVYNTSAFDSLKSLELLEGIVDIYMPDFKFWSPEKAKRYLKHAQYPAVARQVIREMHRQVGVLQLNAQGLAVRGLLVRHLVMPGMLEETFRILEFIAQEISRNTYINIMDQYYPAFQVNERRYPEINRRLQQEEFRQAVQYARQLGLTRLDEPRHFFIEE